MPSYCDIMDFRLPAVKAAKTAYVAHQLREFAEMPDRCGRILTLS